MKGSTVRIANPLARPAVRPSLALRADRALRATVEAIGRAILAMVVSAALAYLQKRIWGRALVAVCRIASESWRASRAPRYLD